MVLFHSIHSVMLRLGVLLNDRILKWYPTAHNEHIRRTEIELVGSFLISFRGIASVLAQCFPENP